MSTRFELVSIPWGDGQLSGILANPDGSPRGLAVHIHGTGGDFYSNPFIEPLGTLYTSRGYSYLSADFPGHHGESVHERFDDSIRALDAWFAAQAGDKPILIQGHSLGTLKALRYMQIADSPFVTRVIGLVLLAPFDVVAFYCRGDEAKAQKVRKAVAGLAQQHGEGALLPAEIFDMWPISLGTMASLIKRGGAADQWPTRLHVSEAPVSGLSTPTLVAIGGDDFASFPTPKAAIEQAESLSHVAAVLIDGAPHNFADRIEQLVASVGEWERSLSF